MTSKIKYSFVWILSIFLWSCIEEINLPLPTGPEKVVVFGWVTDEDKSYEIKVSKTNGFSETSDYPVISGADVYVMENELIKHQFQEVVNTGRYLSDPSSFIGQPGSSYQLFIAVENDLYVSSIETMVVLSPVDSAYINFVADPNEFDIQPDDDNYFVSAYIIDNQSIDNYYRWKVTVNDELRNKPEELVIFDDRFTNGNRFRFDAGNVLFTEHDQATFQHMSLSKEAFDYYKLLKEQTDHSALSPRSQPAVIRGNMTLQGDENVLVLGYFGVSSVSKVVAEP